MYASTTLVTNSDNVVRTWLENISDYLFSLVTSNYSILMCSHNFITIVRNDNNGHFSTFEHMPCYNSNQTLGVLQKSCFKC